MWNKFPADNFFLGLFGGAATLILFYLSFQSLRLALAEHYGNPYFFAPPRVELISILVNIILFRIVIVNFKKEKTGRGILFSTVIIAMVFFFLFYKYNFRLP
jgi:hypothetical protein